MGQLAVFYPYIFSRRLLHHQKDPKDLQNFITLIFWNLAKN